MKKKLGVTKNSPASPSVEPEKLERGEDSRLGLNYALEDELKNHNFSALLDHASLAGKFFASPALVDPSTSIPQVVGILCGGYSSLEP